MDIRFDMFIETEVPENEVIISRTDLSGNITYVNDTFAEISGYKVDELIGKPHNILRHPDMPKSIFKEMWNILKDGKSWEGYIKNMRKDRGYYWVYAIISGVYKNGKLLEYKSIRSPVPKSKRLEMQKLYDEMREREGDPVRAVGYLSFNTILKLKEEADKKEMSIEKLLEEIANSL